MDRFDSMRLDSDGRPKPIPPEADRAATRIVDAAFAVHSCLGPGLLESVYEVCLLYELRKRGLRAQSQLILPVFYDGFQIDAGLRIDALVEGCVIVELKAVDRTLPVHHAQVLTYLKLSGYRLGLLINFNVPLIRDGIRRIVL
jgi:GxxExxY protein